MPLESLSIDRFRNLAPVKLSCSPQFNVFIGPNAAGKTSLLEALYILGRARSFRTNDLDKAIQHGADEFQIVGQVLSAHQRVTPVGIARRRGQLIARIDGSAVKRLSDLASLFPLHWVGGNLHRLLEEGPSHRRQYLDWGLFHVKPSYIPVWKRFQKLLKQRNAALRAARPAAEVQAWDHELAQVGEDLNRMRTEYSVELGGALDQVVAELLPVVGSVEIRYRKGWAADDSYAGTLGVGLARDREQGFTRTGPHRADLGFFSSERPVIDQLSRGQQKLLVIGLQLAQARLLKSHCERQSLFLIDDLGSELDQENQARVMQLLGKLDAQVFATAIDTPEVSSWNTEGIRWFHVKHGQVSVVV